MTVAMDAQHGQRLHPGELRLDAFEQGFSDSQIAFAQVIGNEAAIGHDGARLVSETVDGEQGAVNETARETNAMNAPQETADPLALLGGLQLGPAAPAPGKQRVTEALVLQQSGAVAYQRCDDRNLGRGEFQGKLVLFAYRGIGPA